MVASSSGPVLPVGPEGTIPPARAIEVLRAGGVIVFPSDTVYGLGCNASDLQAVRRLFEIKGRAPERPVPVLLAEEDQVEDFAESVPSAARLLMKRFWPGALTIVLYGRGNLAVPVTAGTGKVGLRVPDHWLPRSLVRALGSPLVGTSANASGKPAPRTVSEVLSALPKAVDLILDGGPAREGRESTVIDCTLQPPRVLREGAVAAGELLAILRV